eukprot:1037810-Prorocentrum_lima.AAC.1
MTSSLVGSEMCIRDSYSALLLTLWNPVLANHVENVRRACPHHSVFTAPVSYTHLTLPTICSV